MDHQLLTIAEVMQKYGVTYATVFRFIKERRFKANRFAQRWLIDRGSLEDYFEAKKN